MIDQSGFQEAKGAMLSDALTELLKVYVKTYE